jgi:hypothetical protein
MFGIDGTLILSLVLSGALFCLFVNLDRRLLQIIGALVGGAVAFALVACASWFFIYWACYYAMLHALKAHGG